MTADPFLAEKARKTEAAMEAFLAESACGPPSLLEAIRYSLFAGGKRFRPALVLGAAELVSGSDSPALPAACAIEMIHTYSLIHDDLPAMDDDDMRRGRPTLHRAFGEALAILAGDTLLTMAFEVLAGARNIQVVSEVAHAAGVSGMAGGQVLDLQGEGQTLQIDALESIHRMKTGALIRASVRSGALLGEATDSDLDRLTEFGEHIGLAFQITDDILDVTGDPSETGKSLGSDDAKEKATYPSIVGLDEARRIARDTADAAMNALAAFGGEADSLRSLTSYVVERKG